LIGDVPSATAILDRFLHRAEVIQITGKSYRLENSEKIHKIPKRQPGPKPKNRRPNETTFKVVKTPTDKMVSFEAPTGGIVSSAN
jgi:hypothetical protein